MEKAVVTKTVKLNGKLWVKGAEFEPPFPDGFEREIEEDAGTIVLKRVDEIPAKVKTDKAKSTKAKPGRAKAGNAKSNKRKADAKEKLRLEKEIFEKFGVQVDRRKTLKDIQKQLAELEAAAELGSEDQKTGPPGETDGAGDTIKEADLENI